MLLVHPIRLVLLAALACVTALSSVELNANPAASSTNSGANSRDSDPNLRLVFLSTLVERDELVIASPADDGEWIVLGEVTARPTFITEWVKVRPGELHLARSTPGGLESKARFSFPQGARSALAVIVANSDTQTYRGTVIDPAEHDFARGSSLLMNLSRERALVALGETRITVEPGSLAVSKATPEANGMYRMMVGFRNTAGEMIVSYDRYVADNPRSRDFLFLLPDRDLGMRVLTLPEFGDAD